MTFGIRVAAWRSLLVAVVCSSAASAFAAEPLRFNRDIRPILSETCWHCHGPGTRQANLRLDLRDEALKETESGVTPIVPGKPDDSEFVRRIFATDAGELMPPPDSHKELTAEQRELLKRWIAEGAVYEKHWSFEPPREPKVPKLAQAYRVNNPIDAFLGERLAKEKLPMSPEADRPTLVRRVAFALTGLPPTPAETDAFVNDKSADAYEKMVDRYLASPRYGEEMARHWLDVARYADTHGLHLDNERSMWLYRDWVVRAFNDDMPFDAFTIEQLAGDLLPNATRDQQVATGFNRCNVSTNEGGSISDEWLYRNAVDRASTMAETWLGLTAGCAVCHDHKYDPISAKEFYSLYAFFYSAAGNPLDGNKPLHEPVVRISTPEQDKQLKKWNDALAKTNADIKKRYEAVRYNDPAANIVASAEDDEDDDEEEKPIGKRSPSEKTADEGDELLKVARDPLHSFSAWVAANGGKAADKIPADLKKLLSLPREKNSRKKPTAEAEKKLLEYYVQHVCVDTKDRFEPLLTKRDQLTKDRDALDAAIPGTAVFFDEAKPRQAFVMIRGQYDKPGEKVEPSVPAFLPPLKLADGATRASRLDLAKWLVAPEHPLTARVTVNRLWQQFFGTGLVNTSFDFGSQGETPSHPELLDWLAVNFRESGWNVKQLVRLMLTSAAFRQSSVVTPAVLRSDPANRLYARGPRFRLDAEQIRDNVLYVSGLINLAVGGKGVNPYQPSNIWEPVAFSGSNTRYYKQDQGDALYRRSLYTFIKRTAPPPFMTNFDAPNREQFCTRRERSNTPLQALQLMNDVQHFEAARAFAERIVGEGGASPDERIAFAYRTVLARNPEADELAIVGAALAKHLARYREDEEAAKQVVAVGESQPKPDLDPVEVAAYTLIANMILNLDETVTRN